MWLMRLSWCVWCRWSWDGLVKPRNMLVPLVSTEYLDYDYQNNSCDEEKMCGHYTQVGRTNTVCARAPPSWSSLHCVCLCAADGVGWHTQSGLCRPSVQHNGGPGLGEGLLPGLQLLPSVSTAATAQWLTPQAPTLPPGGLFGSC